MIKGVFPRLFSTYREGALLSAKFVKTGAGSPIYTLKTNQGNANYNMTLTTGGTGLASLVVTGGARNIQLMSGLIQGQDALIGTAWKVHTYGQTPSTGTILLKFANSVATEAIAALADNDEVHLIVYVDK